MRPKITLFCLVLLSSHRFNLAAEEVIPLPKDGAWARYHVTTTHEVGTRSEVNTRKDTFRFVGTVESNRQKHRWVEQSFGGFEGGHTNVMKTLVAEKDLKSAWPLAADRRWWHKAGDQPVTERNTFGPEFGVFSLVFPGPYNTAKPLHEPRVVDYQRGRLDIKEGLTGRQEVSFQDDEHDITFVMNYAAWRHPDVPLGLAAARISLRTQENGRPTPGETYSVEFLVEDCGEDAITVLPTTN